MWDLSPEQSDFPVVLTDALRNYLKGILLPTSREKDDVAKHVAGFCGHPPPARQHNDLALSITFHSLRCLMSTTT